MPINNANSAALCRAIDESLSLPQLSLDNSVATNDALAPLEITADSGESIQQETMEFVGNVNIKRGSQLLITDRARYTRSQDRVQAEGNITYREKDFTLLGDKADINVETFEGDIDKADVRFPLQHARASAGKVILEGRNKIRLVSGAYTTCDEGDNSWSLTAPRIKLNRAKNLGEAYHAVLRIQKIPVLYTPYLNFPITDKRKSGFLAPSFGSSDESGFEFRLPYYLNLAPNYDATIAPRFIERRGVQLQNEFRYLSKNHNGVIEAEYLPDDSVFEDDRNLLRLKHNSNFSSNWRGELLFSEVSDSEYFEDLGNSLAVASIANLERKADLSYSGKAGTLLTRVQDFQVLDASVGPFKRLPQILYNSPRFRPWFDINQRLRSEWVQFDRDNSVTGQRFDLQPTLNRRFERSWGFFEPRFKLQHTQYRLDDQADGVDANQSRTVPISSLDGGLFFDKAFSLNQGEYVHTLEPRLFYLYVPFRDQSDIPLFDTGANDFNFGQLFRDNRFSGADRIGDANQVSIALTSRLLDDRDGRELAQIAIGQIRHFRDRRVQAGNAGPDTRNSSDFVSRLSINPSDQFSFSGEWQWDPDNENSVLTVASLRYSPKDDRGLNLSYRSRRTQNIEQADLSFFWPLSQRWRTVGRWNYSIEEDQTLESFFGLEYEQCCWRLSVVYREFVNDDDLTDGRTNRAWLAQVELKGLTSLGSPIDALLENGILGFRR